MDITPGTLNALYTEYSQVFQEAFLAQEINWPKLAMLVNSTSESETHVWMDRIPQLREWVGNRIIQNASLRDYVLTNKPFELTLGLDKHKISDNKLAAFEPTVRMIGEQAKKWPDMQVFGATTSALRNGANVITYDGVGYYSTSHPINLDDPNSGVQSNYHASGFGLTPANYGAHRAVMRALKGADGLPLGVRPNVLVVPPALETTGIQILKEQWIAPAAATYAGAANVLQPNPFYGTADLLVLDELAGDDTTWYLLDTSKSVKPFIMQLRQAAQFVMLTNPSDPAMFDKHQVQYGIDLRGAGGYGPWFLASKHSA